MQVARPVPAQLPTPAAGVDWVSSRCCNLLCHPSSSQTRPAGHLPSSLALRLPACPFVFLRLVRRLLLQLIRPQAPRLRLQGSILFPPPLFDHPFYHISSRYPPVSRATLDFYGSHSIASWPLGAWGSLVRLFCSPAGRRPRHLAPRSLPIGVGKGC